MSMNTGHYGGASMILPIGSLTIVAFAVQPLLLIPVLVIGAVLIGVAALAASRRR